MKQSLSCVGLVHYFFHGKTCVERITEQKKLAKEGTGTCGKNFWKEITAKYGCVESDDILSIERFEPNVPAVAFAAFTGLVQNPPRRDELSNWAQGAS
eukprot:6491899-Amphidinium_carterae.2